MENTTKYHVSESSIQAERQLISEAKENPARFEVLYKQYYKSILLFVYQRVTTKEDAYDITSQVFLKAMLHLKNYSFKGVPFSAWLYRIAINEMSTLFRTNKYNRALNIDTDNVGEIAQELDLSQTEKEARLQCLANALTKLEEADLTLIEMRFFENKSFKEIGEILDITENNAKVKVYRIIDKVKAIIFVNRKTDVL